MDVYKCIKNRRSVRGYTEKQIDIKDIKKIIKSAIWAPSGKNGQPWKFKIISDKKIIKKISRLSINGPWMNTASYFILIFLDKNCSYDYVKDVQSCGAAMQNMMLTAYSLGIGSCWVGEVLHKENIIKMLLGICNEKLELMGIITLGYSDAKKLSLSRKEYETFLI